MRTNICSWNIWVFGPRDFKGIANFVKENHIDILGVQEAGVYVDKGKENMAELIAKELGFEHAFYLASSIVHDGSYRVGNAIFSRFPILESKSYQLNPPSLKYDGTYQTEPRILIGSKIDIEGKVLNFLTTHLQFSMMFKSTGIRIAQAEKIISIVKELDGPTVLTGDFNAVPENEEIKNIEKYMTRIVGNEPTWTMHPFEVGGWKVDELKYRLDNIFLSKDVAYSNFRIINNEISDHLPMMLTIDV